MFSIKRQIILDLSFIGPSQDFITSAPHPCFCSQYLVQIQSDFVMVTTAAMLLITVIVLV